MSTKRKYRVNERQWLNPESNTWTGYITTQVEDTSKVRTPRKTPQTFFKMADCQNVITLDFGMWGDEEDRKHSIDKARVLRDAIVRFTDALEAEETILKKRRDSVKKKK